MDFLFKILYYLPYYAILVLIPMLIRIAIEKALGIRVAEYEKALDNPPFISYISYEYAFRNFVLTSLFYPFFEEIIFRAIPIAFLGFYGLIISNAVWVLMHPAWQLQELSGLSLKKKIAFTITSTFYYACNSAFYVMVWLAGDGLIAILYHIFHNSWLTLGEFLKKIEFSIPMPLKKYSKKYGFIREKGEEELKESEEEGARGRFVKVKSGAPIEELSKPLKSTKFVVKKGESEGIEEEIEASPTPKSFIRKKEKKI
jgi:membrane protease YdiL (CAAX protease family)